MGPTAFSISIERVNASKVQLEPAPTINPIAFPNFFLIWLNVLVTKSTCSFLLRVELWAVVPATTKPLTPELI